MHIGLVEEGNEVERSERQPEMCQEVPKILRLGSESLTHTIHMRTSGLAIRAHCHGPVMPRLEWLRPGLRGGRERKRNDLANTHVRDRRKWEGLFTSRTAFRWVS